MKVTLVKFNISIILQVEPNKLMCASVNPVVSSFVILSSLTMSFVCFQNDRNKDSYIISFYCEKQIMFIYLYFRFFIFPDAIFTFAD